MKNNDRPFVAPHNVRNSRVCQRPMAGSSEYFADRIAIVFCASTHALPRRAVIFSQRYGRRFHAIVIIDDAVCVTGYCAVARSWSEIVVTQPESDSAGQPKLQTQAPNPKKPKLQSKPPTPVSAAVFERGFGISLVLGFGIWSFPQRPFIQAAFARDRRRQYFEPFHRFTNEIKRAGDDDEWIIGRLL